MLEEFVMQRAKEQMATMVSQINKELVDNYLNGARNWALNKQHGGDGPPPVVPFNILAEFNEADNSFKIVNTDVPVSTITPESFLPTYKTDDKAIGGPVGGPIDPIKEPGKYYMASGAVDLYAGQVYSINGSVFVIQQPTPFQKYWLKVA